MMDGKSLQAILDEIPICEKAEKIYAMCRRHDEIVRSLFNFGWSKKEDEPTLIEELKQIRKDLNALFQEGA